MHPAEKLQLKAATILPLVGLARSKQDPINRGHGAQYLYRWARFWSLVHDPVPTQLFSHEIFVEVGDTSARGAPLLHLSNQIIERIFSTSELSLSSIMTPLLRGGHC